MTSRIGGSLCAACLVALALDEDEEAPGERDNRRAPVHAYQLVSVLGREPGRLRYLARRQDFHALVSVEVVSGSALGGATVEAIDARLARLGALRHPAIARLLESWQDASGDWCLVSDYLPGRALGAGGRASAAASAGARELAIFDGVCEALQAAHAHGVIHGRLGPESIVLVGREEDLEPRVIGFTVTAAPPALADDLAGLGRILAALAARQPFAAHAAALAERAAREGATIETLRAAAHQLLT